eukprot:TRINITY_DN753_c0_g1_i4.p1 TRINITY_DN753_c0_g1~~TRINITY_DN753_c0_g1_i4.p1  ORF type:complete len:821 (+),score=160.16 TRINITY_DN753_c0_g1_i4:83-2464(+)
MTKLSVPDAFVCPITHQLMRDPVLDPQGHSYERSALVASVSQYHRSPLTGQTMKLEQIIPNRALAEAIAVWTAENPEAARIATTQAAPVAVSEAPIDKAPVPTVPAAAPEAPVVTAPAPTAPVAASEAPIDKAPAPTTVPAPTQLHLDVLIQRSSVQTLASAAAGSAAAAAAPTVSPAHSSTAAAVAAEVVSAPAPSLPGTVAAPPQPPAAPVYSAMRRDMPSLEVKDPGASRLQEPQQRVQTAPHRAVQFAPFPSEVGSDLDRAVDDLFPAHAPTRVLADVHLEAPPMPPQEASRRPPVQLVAVVDKSGSMGGSKIELVRRSLEFVVGQMTARDTMGLVEFDSHVSVTVPASVMDADGKAAATQALSRLQKGTCTNLGGGLVAGLRQLGVQAESLASVAAHQSRPRGTFFGQSRAPPPPQAASARVPPEKVPPVPQGDVCLWLLTDGAANEGCTDVEALARMVRDAREYLRARGCFLTISCFGFGADHVASFLRAIAEVGGGPYVYVSDPDEVADAFGGALGGLMSGIARQVVVKATVEYRPPSGGSPGVECPERMVIKAHTAYPAEVSEPVLVHGDGRGAEEGQGTPPSVVQTVTVSLPDLRAEELRDIVLELQPPQDGVPGGEMHIHATVHAASVLAEGVTLSSDADAPPVVLVDVPPSASRVPPVIERQRLRVGVTAAMAFAQQQANSGDIERARAVLQRATKWCEESQEHAHVDVVGLLEDLRVASQPLTSRAMWQQDGDMMYAQMTTEHMMQRCVGNSWSSKGRTPKHSTTSVDLGSATCSASTKRW